MNRKVKVTIETEKQMEETEDFFEWKCPYTGADLSQRIPDRNGVVLDHIVPHNKEGCGLNIKGNLVWVDKAANAAKRNQSVEDFLLHNETVLKGTSINVREERLQKIKDFQKQCGYNPDYISSKLRPELQRIYKETTDRQSSLADSLKKLI